MVENIQGLYFDWIVSFVYDDRGFVNLSYRKLLETLDLTTFRVTMPMDSNRYQDGIALRYRFGLENYIPNEEIEESLAGECSMLEMMVALSIRIEDHIMGDADIGDRTARWFWDMIASLGLSDMTDSNFDLFKVHDILNNFMERRYLPNGRGGLFELKNPPEDLRNVEIWYQANWYLNEL